MESSLSRKGKVNCFPVWLRQLGPGLAADSGRDLLRDQQLEGPVTSPEELSSQKPFVRYTVYMTQYPIHVFPFFKNGI